jgi:hypothetical protein
MLKTLALTAALGLGLVTAASADELTGRANDTIGAVALGVLQQNPQGDVFDVQLSGGAAYYDDYSGGALLVGTNFSENLYGNLGVFTGFDGQDVGVAASVTYTFK